MNEQLSETGSSKNGPGWFRRNGIKTVIVLASLAAVTAVVMMPKRSRDTMPAEAPPVNVTVMTVTAEPEFVDTFDLPAVVEPNLVVTVSAEVAGRVERIPSKKGSLVQVGDLLIQLNEDLLRPEFEGAEAQYKHDQTEYERVANLVKEKVRPSRDLDNATTQLADSKARLAEVRARLERARIVAPGAGLLNDLFVEEGEYVQAGTPLAELVDIGKVKVVVDVPERDIACFAVGQKTKIFAGAKDQKEPPVGDITFISRLADPRTRSTRMEISLDNGKGLFLSGQIVTARLTRRVLRDVVFVPLLAVIPMEEGKTVYVVNSTEAQRREVELGLIRGDRVQVTRGLSPGDRLIIAGHYFVAPGQKVNVVEENK
ncbi:MAG: efflux RND transporter periplasmic adaptor subunit [Planctomycetota bacterium]|nr:efflux RND transporter periplasmic adaptor subunit [Planctomycetota bacterium]